MDTLVRLSSIQALSESDLDKVLDELMKKSVGAPSDGLYGGFNAGQYRSAKTALDVTITGLSRMRLHPMNEFVLPIKLVDNTTAFDVVVMKMAGQSALALNPELANSRRTATVSEEQRYRLQRYSNGATLSVDLMASPEGKSLMINKLIEFANNAAQTCAMVAYESLLATRFNTTLAYGNYQEYLDTINTRVEMFGVVNKSSDGLIVATNRLRQQLETNAQDSCIPNALIVPHDKFSTVLREGKVFNRYKESGPNGQKRMVGDVLDDEIQGMKVVPTPRGKEGLGSRITTIGCFYPVAKMPGMGNDEIPISYILDANEKRYVPISLQDLIVATGLFQEDAANPGQWVYQAPPAGAPDPLTDANGVLYPGILGASRTMAEWCNGDANWPGFCGYLVRPHETYNMQSLVVCEGGDRLGFTARSLPVLGNSVHAPSGSYDVEFSLHACGVVARPSAVRVLNDAFYNGIVGGTNPTPMNRNDANAIAARGWKLGSATDPASYAILLPRKIQGKDVFFATPRFLHLVRPNIHGFPNEGAFDLSKWSVWYGWNRAAAMDDETCRLAKYACVGPYFYINNQGAQVNVPGNCHHGTAETLRDCDIRRTGLGVM